MGKKGNSVLKESLDRYHEKGVENVLVLEADLKAYKQNQRQVVTETVQKEKSVKRPQAQLFQLMEQSLGIYQDLETMGFQPSALEEAQDIAEQAVEFLDDDHDLMTLLESLKFFKDPAVAHSMAVATTSVMVAKTQGWLHPSNFQKLFLGGLLHDIGLLMIPENIRSKAPAEMTEREFMIYQSHPTLGYKGIVRVKGTPKEVLSIVLEHHEGRTNGFPKKLKETEIHPMARLIALADQFVDYVFGPVEKPGAGVVSVTDALKELNANPSGTFKKEDLSALEKLSKAS